MLAWVALLAAPHAAAAMGGFDGVDEGVTRTGTVLSARPNPAEQYRAQLTDAAGIEALGRCFVDVRVAAKKRARTLTLSFAQPDCTALRAIPKGGALGFVPESDQGAGDLLAVFPVGLDDGTTHVDHAWPSSSSRLVYPRTLTPDDVARFLLKSPLDHPLVKAFVEWTRTHPIRVTAASVAPLKHDAVTFARGLRTVRAVHAAFDGVQGEDRRYLDDTGVVLDLGTWNHGNVADPPGWPDFIDEAANFHAFEAAFRAFLLTEGYAVRASR